MAVTYATTLKNARLQKVIDAIDAGAGPGTMEIGSAGFAVVLAIITLDDPSFDAPSGGAMTVAGLPRTQPNAAATGTAAVARIKDSDGNVVVSGLTVGVGGGFDVGIDDVAVELNQEVRMTSGTITHS